ncbi:type II toxin-antitoxin system Phd/YefM family antitoxin [Kaistia terrae]|uniref:Type II toxin-antitoxin system Phd/YefM family antitoxin n=1 Tax=Kaistia terrae TaxID=537017 RepID=A0ABW0PUT2_9HYPH|nr:type II toxin-antitoxin system Phd/YefM family antitoxin [Kaistia terrae]MCX5579593.1 type II toxin-antitoxin system Phd/YefM family antitoxin [Kaistia terrae]
MGFRAMIRVKMHAAKTTLSKLVAQAQAGEEVVLLRGNTEVARIVPLDPAPGADAPLPPRIPGRLRGLIDFDDRFFDPYPATDVSQWDH